MRVVQERLREARRPRDLDPVLLHVRLRVPGERQRPLALLVDELGLRAAGLADRVHHVARRRVGPLRLAEDRAHLHRAVTRAGHLDVAGGGGRHGRDRRAPVGPDVLHLVAGGAVDRRPGERRERGAQERLGGRDRRHGQRLHEGRRWRPGQPAGVVVVGANAPVQRRADRVDPGRRVRGGVGGHASRGPS